MGWLAPNIPTSFRPTTTHSRLHDQRHALAARTGTLPDRIAPLFRLQRLASLLEITVGYMFSQKVRVVIWGSGWLCDSTLNYRHEDLWFESKAAHGSSSGSRRKCSWWEQSHQHLIKSNKTVVVAVFFCDILEAPFVCAEKKILRTYSLVSFSLCRKCRCLTIIFVKSVEILQTVTIWFNF